MGAQPDTLKSTPKVWHGVQQILAQASVAAHLATYLGQAKFGDLLSPEEESALHANLLKSWALARALNITTANLPTRRLLREVA
jgi:hypothetical protein